MGDPTREEVRLEPCPSGHTKATRDNNNIYGEWWVKCAEGECSWRTAGATEAEAVDAWNTRLSLPAEPVSGDVVGRVALPNNLPGHWDTPDGREMAEEYAAKERSDLEMGGMSDLLLANAQYLVSRDSFELIHYQTAAKERIRWLSAKLALATLTPPDSESTAGKALAAIDAVEECARFRALLDLLQKAADEINGAFDSQWYDQHRNLGHEPDPDDAFEFSLTLRQIRRLDAMIYAAQTALRQPSADRASIRAEAFEALERSAKAVLDACYLADAHEELSDHVDGSLLDDLSNALEWRYPEIWTAEQVERLNESQQGYGHPFTCGGDRGDDAHTAYADENGEDKGQLIATKRGWVCPVCDYRQFWAHEHQFKGANPNPLEALRAPKDTPS